MFLHQSHLICRSKKWGKAVKIIIKDERIIISRLLNEVSLELNLINDCEPGVNLQAEIV